MTIETADVIVVGAGIVGSLCALMLSEEGLSVSVVDANGIGSGATGHGHGILSLVGRNFQTDTHLRLGIRSAGIYPSLVEGVVANGGLDPQYHELPALSVAIDDEELQLFKAFYDQYKHLIVMEWLDGEQARALEPNLTSTVRAAVAYKHGQINAYLLALSAIQVAERKGCRTIFAPVTGLVKDGSGVSGVEIGQRRISAPWVVLAMGAEAADAGQWLGVDIPVFPYYGEVLHLRPPESLRVSTFIMTATHGPIIPRRDGILMVGSIGGSAMLGRNMDTVGSAMIRSDGGLASSSKLERPSDSSLLYMMERALAVMPSLENAEISGHLYGWRPMTPDQLPIVGPVPGVPGVLLATGGGTKGIHLAPITASVVRDYILNGRTDEAGAHAMLLDRFAE